MGTHIAEHAASLKAAVRVLEVGVINQDLLMSQSRLLLSKPVLGTCITV